MMTYEKDRRDSRTRSAERESAGGLPGETGEDARRHRPQVQQPDMYRLPRQTASPARRQGSMVRAEVQRQEAEGGTASEDPAAERAWAGRVCGEFKRRDREDDR